MKRYQVRAPKKRWADNGPDLLRPVGNAWDQVLALGKPRASSKRRADGSWSPWKLGTIGDVRKRVVGLGDDTVLRIADRDEQPFAYVLARTFAVTEYQGATRAANLVNALMREAYPTSDFAGIFVCKRVAGTSSWSDHAWGDAVDRSHGPNDEMTSWVIRMGKAGLMPVEFVVGSRDGKVVAASLSNGWRVTVGGHESHLWHVHVSVRQHSGTPPCAS